MEIGGVARNIDLFFGEYPVRGLRQIEKCGELVVA